MKKPNARTDRSLTSIERPFFIVFLAFALSLSPLDGQEVELTLEEAKEALSKSRRVIHGEWSGEKGGLFIEAIDSGDIPAARTHFRGMAQERDGVESDELKEGHLLVELLTGRTLPDKRTETKELARSVLGDHEGKANRSTDEIYLSGFIYHRFLDDGEKAALAYREILGGYVEGRTAFSSAEALTEAYEQASERAEASPEVRESFRHFHRMMVVANLKETVGPDGTLAPANPERSTQEVIDFIDANPPQIVIEEPIND